MPFGRRLRVSPRYGVLLVLVVAQFILYSAGGDSVWVRVAGMIGAVLVFVVAVITSAVPHTVHRLAIAAGVAASATALALGATDVPSTRGIVGIIGAVLSITVGVTVLRGIGRLPVIDRQTVFGAVSVYLLLGLFFTYVYAAVAEFDHKQFFAGGQSTTTAHLIYFSFVTQTTVGFGDFTAAQDLGRTLAVIEALAGQLYLVTVVALIVSNLGLVRRAPTAPSSGER